MAKRRKEHELTKLERYRLAMVEHKRRIDSGTVTTEHMNELVIVITNSFRFGSGIVWSQSNKVLEEVFGEVPAWHDRTEDHVEGLA
jgi:hypothetical protein